MFRMFDSQVQDFIDMLVILAIEDVLPVPSALDQFRFAQFL